MKTIGPYRIHGLLGKGGMSRVYKVELPVIGKIAALKVLDPHPTLLEMVGEKALRRLFVEEAKILGSFRHPNIAEIWSYGESDGTPHYLMDYYCNNVGMMIGESYRVEEPTRRLPVEWGLRYALQSLEGLTCLHDAGVVHRDIKPYNLLLTDLDEVKISDFGLSKFRGETFSGPPQLKVGSPWYAAPEQEDDPDGVDGSADTYSVGVLLYRMITGNLLGTGAASTLNPPPDGGNRALSSQWDAFFRIALHRKPEQRFQTATEMLAAVTELADAWRERQETVCHIEPQTFRCDATGTPGAPPLREKGCKILARDAAESFQADALMRPRRYTRNAFCPLGEDLIRDDATGRIWQRSGSRHPMTWPEARTFVDELNRRAANGFSDWRLPSIPELMTLLEPPSPEGAWCLKPAFDRRQKRLWSCDRRSFRSAWFVSVDIGFLAWQDMTGYYWVRAVRTST